MGALQRVAADDAAIGMALGSPSQAPPQHQPFRPHNLSQVQYAPPSSSHPSLTSGTASASSPESPVPTPPPPRQKGKWKLFGGLFKKAPPQPQAFYKLEPEADAEAEPDWLHFPDPPAEKEKERGWGRTKSERRPHTAKPRLARSATAPVDGGLDGSPAGTPVGTPGKEKRKLEKKERAGAEMPLKEEIHAEMLMEGAKMDGPLLAVEIPTTQMERYSVMFSSFLDKKSGNQQSTSSLLSRRQATLDRLKSVNETIAELERTEQRLDAQKPNRPRRASSPQPNYSPHHSPRLGHSPKQSPSFSLFPNGATLATHPSNSPTLPTHPRQSPTRSRHPNIQAPNPPVPALPSQPYRLAPKPLARSNTSPAALTPLKISHSPTPPIPKHPKSPTTPTSPIRNTAHLAFPPTEAPPPPPIPQYLPSNPYPSSHTPSTPWTDRTTLLTPSTASPSTPAVHIALQARTAVPEPEWEMILPPGIMPPPSTASPTQAQCPRRYASTSTASTKRSAGSGSASGESVSSAATSADGEREKEVPRELRRKPSHTAVQAQAQVQQVQVQRRPIPMSQLSTSTENGQREDAAQQPKAKGSVAIARQMSIARQREREEAAASEGLGLGVGVARQMSVSRARVTTTSAASAAARRPGTRDGAAMADSAAPRRPSTRDGARTRERAREGEVVREKSVGKHREDGEKIVKGIVKGEKFVLRNQARVQVPRLVGGEPERKSEYGVLVG